MALAAVEDAQTTIDEQVVESEALLEALEKRQARKVDAGAARKLYTEAHEVVMGKLSEELPELADGDVARCGRFKISKRSTPSRDVSFTTSPSSRLTIAVVDE